VYGQLLSKRELAAEERELAQSRRQELEAVRQRQLATRERERPIAASTPPWQQLAIDDSELSEPKAPAAHSSKVSPATQRWLEQQRQLYNLP
jgi:hypothetical protein